MSLTVSLSVKIRREKRYYLLLIVLLDQNLLSTQKYTDDMVYLNTRGLFFGQVTDEYCQSQ